MIGLPESMAMVCMYFSDPPVLREATRRSEVILLYFSSEYLPERQCILSLFLILNILNYVPKVIMN